MPIRPTRLLLLLLPALVAAWPACAEEVRTLTLDQALAIAGERNRAIALAAEFRNRAEGFYVAERAAALPRLTARGTLARGDDDLPGTPHYDRRAAALQLDQALFTWGELQAAVRAAQINLQSADERVRASRQDALREAATAFYDVLLARELNDVFSANLAQKNRRLGEARQRQAVGLATDYDVLVAEVAEANARPEVVRTANLIRSRRDRLRLVLGSDAAVDAAGSLAAEPAAPPAYDTALAVARERRPELRDLRHRLAIAGELVTVARAGDKPRLDLNGVYGREEIETPDNRNDANRWEVGLTFSWPLFDGLKTRGRVQQAKSDLAALRIDEQLLLDSVALEVRETIDRMQVAIELVRALDDTVTQADRLLRLAEKGFEYGVKIRLEVDDAELNLRQARSSLAQARRDYLVAGIDLARAMGILGEETFPGLAVSPAAPHLSTTGAN